MAGSIGGVGGSGHEGLGSLVSVGLAFYTTALGLSALRLTDQGQASAWVVA